MKAMNVSQKKGSKMRYSNFQRIRAGAAAAVLAIYTLGATVCPVCAIPQDGNITAGAGTIAQNGSVMNINQSSDQLVVNWQQFNIAAGETVSFNQPSAQSVALNRVLGPDPSSIFGQLSANGSVFLVNPGGVLFAPGARVDAGGLIATTLSITDDDFLSRNYRFGSSGVNGSIINQGSINADGGYVVLTGANVSNEGSITANGGTAALVGGSAMTLDLTGQGKINAVVDSEAVKASIDNKGLIQADGGKVLMTLTAADSLLNTVLNQSGIVRAQSVGDMNGEIALDGGIVVMNGTIDATGPGGGSVDVMAGLFIQDGNIKADGTSQGGTVDIQAGHIVQTNKATLTANSSAGNGGRVTVQATDRVMTSAAFSATGDAGGQVDILGDEIILQAAKVDAGGKSHGGQVHVGGDFQGGGSLQQATKTTVNSTSSINVSASELGDAGTAVVWSTDETVSRGSISAVGGAQGGNGGTVEISGQNNLLYGGIVNAGAPKGQSGSLLLDPRNITIGDSVQLNSSGTLGYGWFGGKTTILSNGNYVVSDSNYAYNDLTGTGAVYLFDGFTYGLIGFITGSNMNDTLGKNTNPMILSNNGIETGNFVINSQYWNGARGAVTWGSGTAGFIGGSGIISSANSLVGTSISDYVGYRGITTLTNGNYVVCSYAWNNGGVSRAGAVTWGNGATGTTGAVSAVNSLVGTTANDQVGMRNVTALTNGNYVVDSYIWNNGKGAVTWGNGTTGTVGPVSAANSLVGASGNDNVGSGNVIALSNGNYVVSSIFWDNGAASNAGAVTWGNGATGTVGVVSAANSLVGTSANDTLGSTNLIGLTNGNYAVSSPSWDNGAVIDAGAVTWGNGTTGTIGAVSAANSLVGTSASDMVGSSYVTALTNGNYAVSSPMWDNGAVMDAGAVTWGNGTTGTVGAVSTSNSLVGTSEQDQVGWWYGITTLTNGNYVVSSPLWDNGAVMNAGAVTWGNGTTGTIGTVSAENSLVGTSANDTVGSGYVTGLTNGNYVVSSTAWDNGAVMNAGAVTWGNGTTGTTGAVSTKNSLVGTSQQDQVGYVTGLINGNYVVRSWFWNNGSVPEAGAVTWGNGVTGTVGTVSAENSLVGTSEYDWIGSGGVTALSNGNYVVAASSWNNGPAMDAGVVTWGNGTTGTIGTVSAENSLVGASTNDMVGMDGITALSNGNYVVQSHYWHNGSISNAGAVTLGGANGGISESNSITGAAENAGFEFNVAYNNITGDLYISNGVNGKSYTYCFPTLPGLQFPSHPTHDVTSVPSLLTDTLNTGTSVTLQASNDITVNSGIFINNSSGNGGDLTMTAGRNINVNANITTDNGNLTMIANAAAADGIVETEREAGAGGITMAAGTIIDAGTGGVTLHVKDGSGIANASAGEITLANLAAGSLSIDVAGTGNISQQPGSIDVSGHADFKTSGTANLMSRDNDFNTVSFAGGDLSLCDNNSVMLGNINAANLELYAWDGDITQSGAMSVSGHTTLGSGGNITLNSLDGFNVVTIEGYNGSSTLKLDDSTSSIEGGHTYNISGAQASGVSAKMERVAKDSLAVVTVYFNGINSLEMLVAQGGGSLNTTYLAGITQDLTGTMGTLEFDGRGSIQRGSSSPLNAYGTSYGEVSFHNFAARNIFNIITDEYTASLSTSQLVMLLSTYRSSNYGSVEGQASLVNNGARQPEHASGDGSDDDGR